jgi:16S rRNA (cytosine967-C5)-methyltransferase
VPPITKASHTKASAKASTKAANTKASEPTTALSARQLALNALRQVHQGAYADVAIDRTLKSQKLDDRDRRLFTEIVYGAVRHQRTLDAAIDALATKPASQQPPNLRVLLHLGLYQILFLDHIPSSAAVDTTVDLAKKNGLTGLAGFVNGLLRRLVRQLEEGAEDDQEQGEFDIANLDKLLKTNDKNRLGIHHSYPDWMTAQWVKQFGIEEAEALCEWMNNPPHLDIRLTGRTMERSHLQKALENLDIVVSDIPYATSGLRLSHTPMGIQDLPGFKSGDWIVQDASAQLVSQLVDPQPGEIVADLCAAPGGKTVHLAGLMQNQGCVIALDKTASRLKKIHQNCDRLGLTCVQVKEGDARLVKDWLGKCDRVLVDAPCSGLGTLHRHADARWRQTPETVAQLADLQLDILTAASAWAKPTGKLIYSTCTLHPLENEEVIKTFLAQNPDWQIDPPASDSVLADLAATEGWIRVLPHHHDMDGFFMVRLKKA